MNGTIYTMFRATALDASGTCCAYAEVVDRSGVSASDIGLAVMQACDRLTDKVGCDASGFTILCNFSMET